MKQRDIKPCIGCDRGVMHDNCIAFYRLRADHLVADLRGIQQIHGMEMVMGHPALAAVMGPDPDIAQVATTHDVWVCNQCAVTMPLAALMEMAAEKESG